MHKPEPYLVRATRQSLENEFTQSDATLGSKHSSNAAPHLPGRVAGSSDQRLILISRPGLVSDCLHNALNECGYETVLHSLSDPLRAPIEGANLVVISVGSNEPDGLAAVRQRAQESRDRLPGVPAMALIEQSSQDLASGLADVGLVAIVQGYLSVKIVTAAIHLVMVGGSLMTTKICLHTDELAPLQPDNIIEAAGDADDMDFSSIGNFTKREIALLTRLRQGMQNKMIAYELGIAESTVKVHLRHIMSKLNASNRTQVAYMLAGGPVTAPKSAFHKLEPINIAANVSEPLSVTVDPAKASPATGF
ncbi:response regulator transcription factor [Bradyrhizobium lablabi]|uniref:helix-turn-helix transcriptional regulator n=1 Tax=Bradyrhizobium lablabi TaxID=722472 RepID=UPI001BAA60C3|nr:response regulator transcription factor [Bradyrhizobium lablabi]MBR0693041.1 response regulator transcription factor [Bradyrhizobium lablabi]